MRELVLWEKIDAKQHLTAAGLVEAIKKGVDPMPTTVVNVRTAAPGSFLYVGRYFQGRFPASPWGNPFGISRFATERAKRECLERYREWLLGKPELLARLPELRGKVLGCFCCEYDGISEAKPLCHAVVLAELADGPLGDPKGATSAL